MSLSQSTASPRRVDGILRQEFARTYKVFRLSTCLPHGAIAMRRQELARMYKVVGLLLASTAIAGEVASAKQREPEGALDCRHLAAPSPASPDLPRSALLRGGGKHTRERGKAFPEEI